MSYLKYYHTSCQNGVEFCLQVNKKIYLGLLVMVRAPKQEYHKNIVLLQNIIYASAVGFGQGPS